MNEFLVLVSEITVGLALAIIPVVTVIGYGLYLINKIDKNDKTYL